MRGEVDHQNGIFLAGPSPQVFLAFPQAGAACIQYVHVPHMHRHSADECMRYFLDNGEKLDKDFGGTIFESTIRFVRNVCSIDSNHRFGNEK